VAKPAFVKKNRAARHARHRQRPGAAANAKALGTKVVTSEEIHRRGVSAAIDAIPRTRISMSRLMSIPWIPRSRPTEHTTGRPQLCRNRRTDEAKSRQGKLVGLDIVELILSRSSGRTAQTAIRLMVDLLAAAF